MEPNQPKVTTTENVLPPVPEAEVQQPVIDGNKLTNNEKKTPEEADKAAQRVKFRVPASQVLRLYVVPIGSVIIFFGILLFLVIPGVNNIFSTLDTATSTNEQSIQADQTLAQLQALASKQSQLQSDLDLIRNLAPAGATQVTAFQQKIIELAEASLLEVTEATLEETILQVEGDDVTANLGLIEIPSRFSIEGSLGLLTSFVTQIQTLDDFVIIGEMTLRTNQVVNISNFENISDDDWTLSLTLIKYQFQVPDEQNRLDQFYQNVPPTVSLEQDVIDFAKTREVTQQQTIQEESGDIL